VDIQTPVHINGPTRVPDEGLREPGIGSESQWVRGGTHLLLPRISADERPLFHLTLELNHVEDVITGVFVWEVEVPGLAFDGQPRQRDRGVCAYHAETGIEPLETDYYG